MNLLKSALKKAYDKVTYLPYFLLLGPSHLRHEFAFANEPHLRELRRHQGDRLHLHPPQERPQKVCHDLRPEDPNLRIPLRSVAAGQPTGKNLFGRV